MSRATYFRFHEGKILIQHEDRDIVFDVKDIPPVFRFMVAELLAQAFEAGLVRGAIERQPPIEPGPR